MNVKKLLFVLSAAFVLPACNSDESLPGAVILSTPRYDSVAKTATLTWTASTDENFASYKVYRKNATAVDESSTLIATITDVSTITYDDSFDTKPAEYYYYKVYVENLVGATGSNEVILNGLYLFQFEFGSCGTGDGQFLNPADVAVDSDGNIYVADTDNNRIQKFNPDGNFVRKWGEFGTGDGQYSTPYSIEFGPNGKFYIGDYGNNRVQIVDIAGTYLNEVAVPEVGDSYISSDGNIYAPDYIESVVKTFNSSLVAGADIGTPEAGDGQLVSPWDVAGSLDETKIYVLDTGNDRVKIFLTNGTYVSQFANAGSDPGQCLNCWGLAVDNYGYVYVVDRNQGVQIYDADGTFIEEFATQLPDGASEIGIWGLDFDDDNNMYVVDSDSCVVQKYGP